MLATDQQNMGGNATSKPEQPPRGGTKKRRCVGTTKTLANGSATLAGSLFASMQTVLMTDVDEEKPVLGKGSYAVVKEITCKGERYAAKQLHTTLFNFASPTEREGMLTQFAKECRMLQRAAHPNIVKFVGVYLENESTLPYLVMEFMKVTLSDHLEQNGKLDTPSNYHILSDVALGLQFLHRHIPSIIHRDLSANNVLLSSTMQAKISDLGVAKIIDHNLTQKSKLMQTKAPGTPCYMPPEALNDNPDYDTSIDVYSFGVLVVHLLCAQWPMPSTGNIVNPENPDKLIAVTEFDRRLKFIEKIGLNHALMPLIQKCLHNNPLSRPNATNLAETLMEIMVWCLHVLIIHADKHSTVITISHIILIVYVSPTLLLYTTQTGYIPGIVYTYCAAPLIKAHNMKAYA